MWNRELRARRPQYWLHCFRYTLYSIHVLLPYEGKITNSFCCNESHDTIYDDIRVNKYIIYDTIYDDIRVNKYIIYSSGYIISI